MKFLQRKLFHAIAGGLTGLILGDDPRMNALSGTMGTFVSELVATSLSSTTDLKPEDCTDIARLTAEFTALIADFDMSIENLPQLIPISPRPMGHSWDSWGQKTVTNLHKQQQRIRFNGLI